MNRFVSLGRSSQTLVVLAVFGLVASPQAALADWFEASGSYVDTSGKKNTTAGTLAGEATQGAYTGEYWHKKLDNLTRAEGRATFDFGGGNSLTLDYSLEIDPETNLYVGAYVVKGGTGTLKGAAGGGTMVIQQTVPGQGLTWASGELFVQ